jgi:hypothetical protein
LKIPLGIPLTTEPIRNSLAPIGKLDGTMDSTNSFK